MAPKLKNSDAGNWDMPEKIYVLPLSEKVKVLHLKRKEKKSNAEVVKIYGKNKSICEIVKEKKFVLVLLLYLKLQ